MSEPVLPMPPGIAVEQTATDLRITRRWNRGAGVAMLVFAVLWDGFLIFWYSMVVATHAPLIFALFPLIHVAVGVGITYSGLANVLNATSVTVGQGMFTITHAPIPWPKPAPFHTWELQQLYTKRHISRGRNSTTTTYSLDAVMQDGRSRTLVSGLENADQGRFLESRLEQYIGIMDSKVIGEVKG
jgi:hypothetical protein